MLSSFGTSSRGSSWCVVPAMAAKLKDGLFLGDFETAQDMEFILANKVRRRSDSMPHHATAVSKEHCQFVVVLGGTALTRSTLTVPCCVPATDNAHN